MNWKASNNCSEEKNENLNGEQSEDFRQDNNTGETAECCENGEKVTAGEEKNFGEDEITRLKKELEQEKEKVNEYYNRLVRLQADFDNFRRRSQQEKQNLLKYASATLAGELLPVLDNFQRALSAPPKDAEKLLEGVRMIYRQVEETLEKEGLKAIEAEGQEFDPNMHEAAMQEETDEYPDNTVIEEMRKGYYFKDKLLRPAMVKVARSSGESSGTGKEKSSAGETEESEESPGEVSDKEESPTTHEE